MPVRRLLSRATWPETARIAGALRTETVGGALLLSAALAALVWANSPWHQAYDAMRHAHLGITAWHLNLSLEQWAADGLLALFFLVAGIELKHEVVVGDLSQPAKAVLPLAAATAGVVLPALAYLAVTAGAPGTARGWAIPTATDIAFALAVLAVVGTHLPSALRAFLLTLAVVDDLIAISIIAVAYTDRLSPTPLLYSIVPLAIFAVLSQQRTRHWWLLTALGLLTWGLVHASGVHATVAGILLGLCLPVHRRPGEDSSYAHRVEHRLRPLSAGFAVPVFALFTAGVSLRASGNGGGLGTAIHDRAALGVVVALVIGKAVGVFGGSWLVARFSRAELDEDLSWGDIAGVALLSGVGFTVSLLIGDLAFGLESPRDEHIKLAVLFGSLVAAMLACVVLRARSAAYARIAVKESADDDGDGIPDAFQ